jgi:hypothetical protein
MSCSSLSHSKQGVTGDKEEPMKYICLGYIEPGKFAGMNEAERNATLDDCFEHNDHLRLSPKYLFSLRRPR